MSAHRAPRRWYLSLAIGAGLLLLLPGAASADPPVCEGGPFLYDLPAGLSHLNPRPRCTDADGDAMTIEVRTPPHLGTLSPAGAVPTGELRFYTANADAAALPAPRDRMTFVAVAGGEESNPITIDVRIKPADQAPVCDGVAVTVEAGHSVRVPAPRCTDADNGAPTVVFDPPRHGAYDVRTRRYTPKAGFSGTDTMTFAAVDYWGVSSKVARVTITVRKGSGHASSPPPRPSDRRAPRLTIDVPASLDLATALRQGILFTAGTDEAGRLGVRLSAGRRAARRLHLRRHPRHRVRVGRTARHILAGKTVVRVRLSHRARTRLEPAGRIRLRLAARLSDAAGNVRTARTSIVLVRAAGG